ncbi:MerR family transcriptional regulator [Clostridium rectalis]|uniref:MerR family transcriptional regulator n=1 Tax=Clostridium rectalis TaxID=2040295 RepID=UPI000F630144|nr:MerR family transcriptional regulator [Clostridium rectalis]
MESNTEKLFSVGEFAKKAGVTIRTLRYYDKIGLLVPTDYSELGYRLYSKQDFAKLQKILTLKFIGLSLEEIGDIMKYDINDKDFKKSLYIQKQIIEEKIRHMFTVVKAIDETIHMVNEEDTLNWNKFINIINVLSMDKKWVEQYKNASNLRARINLHEKFSSNKQGWMQWCFQQLNLKDKDTVLELGCGDATFWVKNLKYIPKDLGIVLTDYSQGMLKDAKNNLENKAGKFKFKVVNAENIPYEDNKFDIVIANHMLYHVDNVDKALSEIKRVLKPEGRFYASTVGESHMKEMRQMISEIDENILKNESFYLTKKFQLENGKDILSKFFDNIKLKRYEDSLKLTKATPLVDYIFSMPGNIKQEFNEEKLGKLYEYINKSINDFGKIYITKDTGLYISEKDSNKGRK